MKKLKLISASLGVALVLGLVGCGKPAPVVCKHVDEDQNFFCDLCNEELKQVTKVQITNAPESVEVGAKKTLTAVVSGSPSISTEVTWTSSDPTIATVSEFGNVKGVKAGKVTITATSVEDPTKSDSVEIYVEFCELLSANGFTFTLDFPEKQFRDFFGEGDYFVPAVKANEIAERGFYYRAVEANEETNTAAYFDVLLDINFAAALEGDEEAYDLAMAMYQELADNENLYSFYFDDYEAYMDVTQTYVTILQYIEIDDETAYFLLNSYATDNFYYHDLNPKTNWEAEELEAMIQAYGITIPFMQFGSHGAFTSLNKKGFEFVDRSSDYTLGEKYGRILESNGFNYDDVRATEYYGWYQKELGNGQSLYISVGFGEKGNVITGEVSATYAYQFPKDVVNSFVKDYLQSENYVPEFVPSGDVVTMFKYEVTEVDEYTQDFYPYADILLDVTMGYVTYNDFIRYAAKLWITYGYDVVDSLDDYDDPSKTTSYLLNNGKISLELSLYPEYVEDNYTGEWTCDWSHCTFFLTIYDSGNFEQQGVYLRNTDLSVKPNESLLLDVVTCKLGDDPDVEITSADETVATVSYVAVPEDGEQPGYYLQGVSVGSTTITLSVEYNNQVFTNTYTVNVTLPTVTETISFATLRNDADGLAVDFVTPAGIEISFDGGTYGAAYAKGGKLVLSSFTEMEITAPSGSIVTKVEFDIYDFSKDANFAGYTRTPLVSYYTNGFCDADNWYATKKASYAGIYSYYSRMYSDFDTIQGGLDDLNVAVFSGIKVTLNGKTFKDAQPVFDDIVDEINSIDFESSAVGDYILQVSPMEDATSLYGDSFTYVAQGALFFKVQYSEANVIALMQMVAQYLLTLESIQFQTAGIEDTSNGPQLFLNDYAECDADFAFRIWSTSTSYGGTSIVVLIIEGLVY